MFMYRSTLCALALGLGVPLAGGATAEAGWVKGMIGSNKSAKLPTFSALVPATEGTVALAQVSVSLKSDAGSEDVTLVESNAWLHGTATLKALPKADATLALTLYDKASAALVSFSGTLTSTGVVTLTPDATKDPSTDCASKTGCTTDTSGTTVDVEVLAGEVFAGTSGYELTVDLAGADTYEVAYGAFVVTEGKTATKAEIGWEATGSVWDGELALDPEGVIESKVTTYDTAGKKIESASFKLGEAWSDDGEGVNVLATDDDPLTVVGVYQKPDYTYSDATAYVARTSTVLAIVSEGWTATTVPVSAKVELNGGSTLTIPVNSYQRKGTLTMLSGIVSGPRLLVTHGGTTLYDSSLTDLGERSCTNGVCVTFVEDEAGDYGLSVSEYGLEATKLADTLELTVTTYDKSGVKQSSEAVGIEFEDDISAVFANEISFTADPLGFVLAGKVSLLSASDSKGKQKTLAKGQFKGSFSRDGDGELGLAGVDKQAGASPASFLSAGKAVAFELTDKNGDGIVSAPPLLPRDWPGGYRPSRAWTWDLEKNIKG